MPAVDNKYERCAEDDPKRCQGVIKGSMAGQCPYKAVENTIWCPVHGGTPQIDLNNKAAVRKYRLGQYQARMEEFADDTEIKSLREEIAITRMCLENIVNMCKNQNQLLMYASNIGTMVNQIRVLIESAQKLEEKNNNLLDRKVVIVIADSIVTLMGDYITDPDKLTEIGMRICDSIATAASPTNIPRFVSQSDNAA